MTEGHKNKITHKYHFHSTKHRAFYSFLLAVIVLGFGTLGIHWIEGFSVIDSFYFTSMIATGQGPAPQISPVTSLGKLFTSFLAFLSSGVMIASIGFLFGPFLGKLWKVGVEKFEEEMEHLKRSKDK